MAAFRATTGPRDRSAITCNGGTSCHALPIDCGFLGGQPARARTSGTVAGIRRDCAARSVAEPAARFRDRAERRTCSQRKACRKDRVHPVEHQIEVENRSVMERVDRNRPTCPGGAPGFENGRDVVSPIRLIQCSDQEVSRNVGGCRCGAGIVAGALHGQEPGHPCAVNAAEPVRGASPHRVPDKKDGNVCQLGMQTLRAELREGLEQRLVACRVVEQRRRSNERDVSAGELECAPPYLSSLVRGAPDTACSVRRATDERTRVQRITGERVSQPREENDRSLVLRYALGQVGDSVLIREQCLRCEHDVVGIGSLGQTEALRPRSKARSGRDDRCATDRQVLELEPSICAGCRGGASGFHSGAFDDGSGRGCYKAGHRCGRGWTAGVTLPAGDRHNRRYQRQRERTNRNRDSHDGLAATPGNHSQLTSGRYTWWRVLPWFPPILVPPPGTQIRPPTKAEP